MIRQLVPRRYSVYSISDPRIPGDQGIFYIGVTYSVEHRKYEHLLDVKRGSKHPKDVRMRELLEQGVEPLFTPLKTDLGRVEAPLIEIETIKEYRAKGIALTNKATSRAQFVKFCQWCEKPSPENAGSNWMFCNRSCQHKHRLKYIPKRAI